MSVQLIVFESQRDELLFLSVHNVTSTKCAMFAVNLFRLLSLTPNYILLCIYE